MNRIFGVLVMLGGALLSFDCDSNSGQGDSETHWLTCNTSADCTDGGVCEAKRCMPGNASGGSAGANARGKDGGAAASSVDSGAGGASGVGGTTGVGGASGMGGTLTTGGAPATGGTSTTGGTPATGGATPTGGATATGGAQPAGGASGAAGAPDAGPPPVVVTLTMDGPSVGPGGDEHFCQSFANPFGFDAAILESESTMPTGGLYVAAYTGGYQNSPVQPCQMDFRRSIHDSSEIDGVIKYPPGVGRYLSAEPGIQISLHVLNSSSAAVSARVQLRLSAVHADQVQHLASGLYSMVAGLTVHPGVTSRSADMQVLFGIEVIRGLGRMHSHGTHFVAKYGSQILHETTDWQNPVATMLSSPVSVPAAGRITHTCDYSNTTSYTFTFGDSALINEICFFSAIFYATSPADERKEIGAI